MKKLKKIIHINQHKIKSNKKDNKKDPVISVKTYISNQYCNELEIAGPCKIVYSPDKSLKCGAKVWIETNSDVYCDRECVREIL